jgi:hypothetical protein
MNPTQYVVMTGGPAVAVWPRLSDDPKHIPKFVAAVLPEGEKVTVVNVHSKLMRGFKNWAEVRYRDQGREHTGFIALMYLDKLDTL